MTFPYIQPARILLPAGAVDWTKWAVIACDQFTSDAAYWQAVTHEVGDAPSTLHITFPEQYLHEGDARIARIQAMTERYLSDGTLQPAFSEAGFVCVERTTPSGVRPGLVVALDLEAYDYEAGATSPIRATEGTILSRIPPRVRIRSQASIESPHIMVLIDDPGRTVIEPIWARRSELRKLYDFDLMMGGGHIAGYAVEGQDLEGIATALQALDAVSHGLTYAVGDGNHSLATAKRCWLDRKATLSAAEQATHPARYALVELVNLHAEALTFEPIHRVLFHVDMADVISAFRTYVTAHGGGIVSGRDIVFVSGGREMGFSLTGMGDRLPLQVLQPFLDEYLAGDSSIDYIHGEADVRALTDTPDNTGILLTSIDKTSFFSAIRTGGALPRKTFSMGEAREKRYYVECRKIR